MGHATDRPSFPMEALSPLPHHLHHPQALDASVH